MDQRCRQFALQGGEKLAAGGAGGVGRARAADQHDAGGEGVDILLEIAGEFGSHRPGATDGETAANQRIKEGFPAGTASISDSEPVAKHGLMNIELFFKWIKQNLKIKSFLGTSRNAVLTQIWIAVCVYLLLSYIKFLKVYGTAVGQALQVDIR